MKKTLQHILREYEWVHDSINLLGNFTFFIGSILFLWSSLQTAGVWLFILGAFGMMVGSMGDMIVKYEWHDGELQSTANYSPKSAAREKKGGRMKAEV